MILKASEPATVITIREAEMIVKLFDIDGTEMDLEELMALHDMRRRLIGEIGETYRRRMEYEFNRAMERAWSERMEETTSSDRLTAATFSRGEGLRRTGEGLRGEESEGAAV